MKNGGLNSTGLRWIMDLANSNIFIKYRSGVMNKGADFLSRMPRNIDAIIEGCTENFSPLEITSAILQFLRRQKAQITGYRQ